MYNSQSKGTTKKWGYPNVCKTAGIAPKSVGIWSKCLSPHFKLPDSDNWYRVAGLVPAFFKSIGIGLDTFQTLFWHFYLCRDSLFQ